MTAKPSLLRERYEVLTTVGRGGQGEVALAYDHQHNRRVALKIRSADGGREDVLHEARLLLSLTPHPGVAIVRDDFFEGARHYLVMDWVEGKNLHEILREQGTPALPFDQVVRWLEQLARALDHLHGHDPPVIHQDVKPSNILLTPDGRVVLVDFGVAGRSLAAVSSGTAAYIAPEVARGEAPTPRSDVFSLAATAHLLLAGFLPEPGREPILADVPVEEQGRVRTALAAGLSIDPSTRPTTAGEYVQGLRSAWAAPPATAVFTMLFTDLVDSVALADRLGDDAADELRRAYYGLIRRGVAAHGGQEVKNLGDGLMVVYTSPAAAIASAVTIQREIDRWNAANEEQLGVRIGIHTGEVAVEEGDYFGTPVAVAQRLCARADGGHILASEDAARLAASRTRHAFADRGPMQLKGLSAPVRVVEIMHGRAADGGRPPLESLATPPTNLPAQASSFVGREQELIELRTTIGSERLVTLAGPGGVGKTRLALQAAADLLTGYPDGAWLCELASATEAADVVAFVANVIGVDHDRDTTLEDGVISALTHRRTLLVLDNCEHLVEAVARLAAKIVHSCPRVTLLATSREPLRIDGEHVWPVKPLSLVPGPATTARPSLSPAVQLFCDRATAARPDFTLGDEARSAVATICDRLDGLPLAIELAAARVRSMSAAGIAGRLEERFRILTRGDRTADTRHQTLRAAVEWSHELLTDAERLLYARLSVFVGGFTLEAAERVCAAGDIDGVDVVDLLTGLVDKSFVSIEEGDTGSRYRMLETIRLYAAERLPESGDEDACRSRHARYFLDFAEEADHGIRGADEAMWVRRLGAERANVQAAFEWARGRDDVETAMRFVAALFQYAYLSYERELMSLADQALELGGAYDHPMLPAVLGAACVSAGMRADFERAKELGERALLVEQEPGRIPSMIPRVALSGVSVWGGDPDMFRYFDERIRVARETGASYDLANGLMWKSLIMTRFGLGAFDEGKPMAREAVDVADGTRSPTAMGFARAALSSAVLPSDAARALELAGEADELGREARNRLLMSVTPILIARASFTLGDLHGAMRAVLRAVDLWHPSEGQIPMRNWVTAAAVASFEAKQFRAAAILLGVLDSRDWFRLAESYVPSDLHSRVRERLGGDTFEAAAAHGAAMSDAEIADYVRTEGRHWAEEASAGAEPTKMDTSSS